MVREGVRGEVMGVVSGLCVSYTSNMLSTINFHLSAQNAKDLPHLFDHFEKGHNHHPFPLFFPPSTLILFAQRTQ